MTIRIGRYGIQEFTSLESWCLTRNVPARLSRSHEEAGSIVPIEDCDSACVSRAINPAL